MMAVAYLLGSQSAHSQEPDAPSVTKEAPSVNAIAATAMPLTKEVVVPPRQAPAKEPVESEISVMGMIPDGDYRMFSATIRCNAWVIGVEYDRHSLGNILRSRVDYAMEILPFVILSEPAKSDFWGNPKSPDQQYVPGLAILPVGFRFLWRDKQAVRPYVIGKLGAIVFTQKVLSQSASYTNFNIQAAFGLQIRMTPRVDFRIEPFEFFHVSNGYLAASNPGMDELATRIGITYHLGKPAGATTVH